MSHPGGAGTSSPGDPTAEGACSSGRAGGVSPRMGSGSPAGAPPGGPVGAGSHPPGGGGAEPTDGQRVTGGRPPGAAVGHEQPRPGAGGAVFDEVDPQVGAHGVDVVGLVGGADDARLVEQPGG